jgi:hypothetical protein
MFNVMREAIACHGLGVTMHPETHEALPAATPADLLEFATIRGAEACGPSSRVTACSRLLRRRPDTGRRRAVRTLLSQHQDGATVVAKGCRSGLFGEVRRRPLEPLTW